MNTRPLVIAFLYRFAILLAVSILLILALSEMGYRLTKDPTSRPPQVIELVIPAGTAELVAAGQAPPAIPDEMVFVAGDTLLVKNEDTVPHELNALYIPPASSATMPLVQANNYAFSCSFQPTKYLNVTVRQATTWATRLAALWYGVPVTVMFLLAYSFVFWPLKPKPDARS